MKRRTMASGKKGMDWDKLKVFHAAAEAGSFTHAGEQLGLSQSAVSRQVSALEQELSVSLFHRHARGLILTEQGELLYRTAHDVFMKLEAARAKLTDSREKPHGEQVHEFAEPRRQPMDAHAGRGRHLQLAMGFFAAVGQLGAGRLKLHEYVMGGAVEQLALFGQDQPAGVAVKQRNRQFLLECAHLP